MRIFKIDVFFTKVLMTYLLRHIPGWEHLLTCTSGLFIHSDGVINVTLF